MAEQQEAVPRRSGGEKEEPWGGRAPHEAERLQLVQANLRAKALMAAELTADGMGRDSIARLLHVSLAELVDLQERAQLSQGKGGRHGR
ncbi:MAG: hypothetical protein JW832_13515 [Deltaproteobacteria bacterium]|nr:hypothetical protein [Deltaproteobacteria bacterium]